MAEIYREGNICIYRELKGIEIWDVKKEVYIIIPFEDLMKVARVLLKEELDWEDKKEK